MSYYIDEDNYYKRKQPAKSEELINIVQVPVQPLELQDYNDEAYKGEPILFAASESKTIEIKYSDVPMKDVVCSAYLTDEEGELLYNESTGKISNTALVVFPANYYAWGAVLTIENTELTEQYVVIVAAGYVLKVIGKLTATATDEEGIIENGELEYSLKKNHLIQNNTIAQAVADTLLASYSIARKDVNLDWRGNLCLRLMNEIETIEYNKEGIFSTGDYYIFKQQTTYDGTVKQLTDGRKII